MSDIVEQLRQMAQLNWLGGMTDRISRANSAIAEIENLRQEVDFLRRYGNKDCTNMADVALEEKRRTGKAPFEC